MGFLPNMAWYQCYRAIIYVGCVTATLVQLASVLEGYLSPTMTNTVRETKDLVEFPLVFKICFKAGFNTTVIEETGYDSPYYYFLGQSKFNRSIFGWGGHTNASEVLGTGQEIRTKVENYSPLESLGIYLKNGSFIEYSSEETVKHEILNYPDNCQILDLTNSSVEEGIKEIYIYFGDLKNSSVEVHIEGASLSCDRFIKENALYSSEAMKLDDQAGKIWKNYGVQINQDVFMEDVPNNNCKVYPNSKFASYR